MSEVRLRRVLALLFTAILLIGTITYCEPIGVHAQDSSEAGDYIKPDQMTIVDVNSGLTETGKNLTADVLSVGGGGMLFNPQISPHDPNLFTVLADMGGMYISYDSGETWERRYLKSVVNTSCFDPNREGVIYAGGAGLYRSTDNGKSFQIIFPNEDDILEMHINGETPDVQFFTKSRVYPQYLPITNVLVNPENSDNIFVAAGYGTECKVYESKDNGNSFALLGSITKEKYNPGGAVYDFTELFYAPENNTLYIGAEDGIFRYNRNTKKFQAVLKSSNGLADVTTFQKDGKTYFVYIDKEKPHEKADSGVYYTTSFKTTRDITDKITANLPTSFWNLYYTSSIDYKYDFSYVEANGLDQIYVSSVSRSSNESYPYNICGLLYYNGKTSNWLYGNPFNDARSIVNVGYWDDDTTCYGISVDWDTPGRFIETTLSGIVYSPYGDEVYQETTDRISKGLTVSFSSRGIDEHVVYKVVVDPFDSDHVMLLTTDWGLQESFDQGETFSFCNRGIPVSWQNTTYDLVFNEKQQGVVYSIWSGNHSGFRNYIDSLDNLNGGFAYSYDGGKNWDVNYSEGLPDTCLPVEMSIVYPDDSDEVTIYVATLIDGFFVSYDSGKTFTALNEGLEKVNHKGGMGVAHSCIPASDIEAEDGRVFGIIQNISYPDPKSAPGGVYELKDGTWQEIDIRSSESGEYAVNPKDINYYKGDLFINYIAHPVYLDSDTNGYNQNHGGGILYWDGKNVRQIFDESISTTGLQMSSDGTIYASDIEGNIYRYKPGTNWEYLYRHFHFISSELQLFNDSMLFLTTNGGGALRLTGLDQ